jgi:hypothetical protein
MCLVARISRRVLDCIYREMLLGTDNLGPTADPVGLRVSRIVSAARGVGQRAASCSVYVARAQVTHVT